MEIAVILLGFSLFLPVLKNLMYGQRMDRQNDAWQDGWADQIFWISHMQIKIMVSGP